MPHNIIHVICHDLGRELGCYGNPTIPSPNLDRFAAEGLQFTNYFAASTPCSPSRGCIMTGKYAHSNGLIGLTNRGWDMPEAQTTIVDCLNDAGYHTALFGFHHERKNVAHNHYQHVWTESRDAKRVAAQVAEYLQSARTPFYINAGFFEVHLPFDKPYYEAAHAEALQLPDFLPDTPDVRAEVARFFGSIRYMDEALGGLFEAIDAAGHRRDTIVLFTTDHGAAFPRAKSTLYDAGIGTALLLRFPEGYRGVRHELLSNIDLMPTLLDAVGVAIPEEVQGRSFLTLLKGAAWPPRECVFAEKNFHDHYDPVRAIRTTRYKYIRSFTDAPAIPMPVDIQQSIASRAFGPESQAPRPREELYDVQADPCECANLAGDPALAGMKAGLSAKLDAWMRDTNDPLLERIDLPYPPEQFQWK